MTFSCRGPVFVFLVSGLKMLEFKTFMNEKENRNPKIINFDRDVVGYLYVCYITIKTNFSSKHT